MMQIPEIFPGLKWLTIICGVYAAIWIALEGVLWREVSLAILLTAVLLLHIAQNWFGGRVVSARMWVAGTAVCGFCWGLGSSMMTLLLMVLKTGLHAHGPEFTPAEISWVLAQIPLWTAVGLLTGVGVGLVIWGIARVP